MVNIEMDTKDSVNVNLCNVDMDCKKNEYCSFDETKLQHSCIPKEKKILYQGCLNTKKFNEFDKIESKSKEHHGEMDKCIDFVREQKNKDGLHYNYMIYKNKINSFVDLNTINIYLKCNKELLLVMPSKDFFVTQCDNKQQKCVLKPNQAFMTFVQSNAKTCGGKLSLEVEYSCENENIDNTIHVDIDTNNLDGIEIDLTCPVNVEDSKFQSSCVAAYFDTRDSNPDINRYLDLLDKNIEPEDCVQPVYKVPMIVSDMDVYQQLMKQKADKNVKDYNKMLWEKEEEMNKLKMDRLKIQYRKDTGLELADEEARRMVEANKTEYFKDGNGNDNNNDCVFKVHENKHPFGNTMLEENDILKYSTPVDGKYYMIEQAKQKACDLNATMFLWFSNSYDLSNLRNKLYVITPTQWDTIKNDFKSDDWKKWSKVNNVHVGMKSTNEEIMREKFEDSVSQMNDEMKQYYYSFLNYFEQTQIHTNDKVNNNDKTIKKLDDTIMTLQEDIKKNEFEEDINNQMTMILSFLLLFLIILGCCVYIYNNYLQK